MRRSLLLAPILLAAGCDPAADPQVAPQPTAPTAPPSQTADTPPPPAKSDFKNPGGMWMPEQLRDHKETLHKLGLALDPDELTKPDSKTLSAIVNLSGCSASFVSPDGLVATNHHCVTNALQINSTPQQNLLHDGFVAKSRAEERYAGPATRIYVTQALKDVTKEVRDGIEAIQDDEARYRKIEEHQKALVAACEKDRPGIKCHVASFYGGGAYRLVEQLEIRDVRLVFSPHDQIGDFGGEVDNWRWPRHSGDVSLVRAYVGKDGKSAEYSPDNVPYKPRHHLPLATKPLEQGDFVFVAGYPGVTNRLKTGEEAKDATAWRYPRWIQWCHENSTMLQALAKTDAEIALKARPRQRGFDNFHTKMKGILEGLTKGGYADERLKIDMALKAWIDKDPARKAAYGDVLAGIQAVVERERKTREADATIWEIKRSVSLYTAALTIVRLAEEREKPDAAREPEFQERKWPYIYDDQTTIQKRYDPAIDKALLKMALVRALRLPEGERPAFLKDIFGKKHKLDEAGAAAVADELYKTTKLHDIQERLKLLKEGKTKDLKKSKDPLIALAYKLLPAHKAYDAHERASDGALALVRPRYIEALQKYRAEATPGAPPLAPDANSTLRITYGTVRGYSPSPGAPVYRPFTAASEILKKNTGVYPFDSPKPLLDAINAKKFGPYAAAELGEVPVDFLTDLDITGGNSGSATINAKGEIVGLAFDGNYEAQASDWLFLPEVTRTIHVDMRYVLWLLDAVAGGDHLIQEMGGKPAL